MDTDETEPGDRRENADKSKPWSVAMATPEDLEQKLTCSICLQLFQDPRLLPCGHTYCQHCLTCYIASRAPASNSRGQQGFLCPVCREFVQAPDRLTPPHLWACKFKPNFLIRDIVEVHGKNKQRVQRPMCPLHPNKPLELYCRDCRTSVCDRCVALNHRRCEEVLELSEVCRETQQATRKHQQTVTRLLKQLEAKKRRCTTGRRELERIERDMDAKIEREGQELLRKVADFLRSRKESLKRQAHAHCRQCVNVVNAYTEKCDELTGALRALDRVLGNKLRPDRPHNKIINAQEESKLSGMVQKLEMAVQQLDSPCHFTVRLIMDDSALTAILNNLKLGEIRTGDNGDDASGRPSSGRPASASSAASFVTFANGAGYAFGVGGGSSSTAAPERSSSAASAFPSGSASSLYNSQSPLHFSPNSSAFSLNSASPSPSSASASASTSPLGGSHPAQPAQGFSSLRSRVVSDSRLSSHDNDNKGADSKKPGAVAQCLLPPPEPPRRKSVSKNPFDFMDRPAAPMRRKLSQP